MPKPKTKYVCQQCGHESLRWLGRCPNCNEWNSLVEEVEVKKPAAGSQLHRSDTGPQAITAIETSADARYSTGNGELDRVLGGGVVPGSLVLVGGDPGIGKSTLLLQAANNFSRSYGPVLYVSGEESARQVRMRADRLTALSDRLLVVAETDLTSVEDYVSDLEPVLLVIDSIQTVSNPDLQSAPGSVGQVRECTARLMNLAKTRGVPVFIVGHVTKEGTVAGPRVLEHIVDTVLYFEGERHNTYRILRAEKNRFGSTNEIGIFEMRDTGLVEVTNPSELFLSERSQGVPGSVVVACMEGTRPVLVELQALVSPTNFGMPRRMATGVDYNRLSLLMAVLEKRVGLHLQSCDAYLKIAGGVRIEEPAVDLGVVVAVASSFRDQAVQPRLCVMGEVGLGGEVRAVSRVDQRVKEAVKLGFTTCLLPATNVLNRADFPGVNLVGVDSVEAALEAALAGR